MGFRISIMPLPLLLSKEKRCKALLQSLRASQVTHFPVIDIGGMRDRINRLEEELAIIGMAIRAHRR